MREAIVASDSPDKAHVWLSKVWDKEVDEKELRDSEGFSTLDAKIMSALTNIIEGDFGRQTDTFKETEALAGRMVRGRQLLHRLHNYFATNALHGSVYDMEDLMNCNMVNNNLTVFLRNWDTILSGIPIQPDDNSVLEPLFHRQVKKCKVIAHDVSVYDRALEGNEQKSYQFLYNAANNHLERERLQKNRDRIARQAGGAIPTIPAPNTPKLKRVPKGFCIDFVRNGRCTKDKCPYKHEMPRGRSRTPGGGRAPSRTPSPGAREKASRNASSSSKDFAIEGISASFSTTGAPAAPAPGSSARTGSSDRRRKKKEKREKKGRKGSKSSSRSSKSGSRSSSRSSKGSKGSKGSGRRSAPSVPAAVCLLGAMLAGSASQADAFTFRKDMSSLPDYCTPHFHVAMPAVSFNDAVQSYRFEIPKGNDLFPIEDRNKPRVYDKVYPVGSHWSTAPDSLREAQLSAKMLQAVVHNELLGQKAPYRYRCDTEFGCKQCIPNGMSLSCPASSNTKAPCLPIEWIADTGSAQDLIAERELGHATPFESGNPISMMTASGPNSANKQCDVSVDSIGVQVTPYVLPDTPSVLSIGQRCKDEGFDFVWRANSRPYLRSPEGKEVFMDVKDNVPYLKAWPENIFVPAQRVHNNLAKTKVDVKISATGRSAPPGSEEVAKSLRESGDFSHASCYKLLKKASKNKRSIITSDSKSPDSEAEYVVLGAFCRGGMRGLTNRSHQN